MDIVPLTLNNKDKEVEIHEQGSYVNNQPTTTNIEEAHHCWPQNDEEDHFDQTLIFDNEHTFVLHSPPRLMEFFDGFDVI